MGVDLRRLEIRIVVVVPLAGEHPVHTIIDVAADDQRILQIVIFPNVRLFFMQDIDQAVRIDDRWLFARLLGNGDRKLNEVDVVAFWPAFSGQRLQLPFSPGNA